MRKPLLDPALPIAPRKHQRAGKTKQQGKQPLLRLRWWSGCRGSPARSHGQSTSVLGTSILSASTAPSVVEPVPTRAFAATRHRLDVDGTAFLGSSGSRSYFHSFHLKGVRKHSSQAPRQCEATIPAKLLPLLSGKLLRRRALPLFPCSAFVAHEYLLWRS